MYEWRNANGLGQVANALTCIAYNGPDCQASAYPQVGGLEYNPAILPSPQPAGVYAAIPWMSGGGGANPADPTEPEFLWAATGEPYVPGQTTSGGSVAPATSVASTPAASSPVVTPAAVVPNSPALATAAPAAQSPAAASSSSASSSSASSSVAAAASTSGMSTSTLLILAALGVGILLLGAE